MCVDVCDNGGGDDEEDDDDEDEMVDMQNLNREVQSSFFNDKSNLRWWDDEKASSSRFVAGRIHYPGSSKLFGRISQGNCALARIPKL